MILLRHTVEDFHCLEESYGALLVPIILAKLSVPTCKNLAWEHSNLDWSIDNLQVAILEEIGIMETEFTPVMYCKAHVEAHIPRIYFMLGSREHSISPPHNGKKKQLCVYCKDDHCSSVCKIVTDVQKKLEIGKRRNLCFNCLGNHKVSFCNSMFQCRNCKHKHHTSLWKPISEDPKLCDKRDNQVTDTLAQANTPVYTN